MNWYMSSVLWKPLTIDVTVFRPIYRFIASTGLNRENSEVKTVFVSYFSPLSPTSKRFGVDDINV